MDEPNNWLKIHGFYDINGNVISSQFDVKSIPLADSNSNELDLYSKRIYDRSDRGYSRLWGFGRTDDY